MTNGRAGYEDLPIVDAARRCGIVLKSNTLGRDEVEAKCPFCGDKPGRWHLFLNTVRNQYKCWLCGAGGNSVSLYARLNSVSYAEAAQDLLGGSKLYQLPSEPQRRAPPEREPKPLAERHGVYHEMLEHLALSGRHLSELRGRGLSDERIRKNMYRTLPKDEAARRFLAGMLADFHDLSGIPGFYTDNRGRWTIAGKGGLLIPVRSMNGYIQGLQVRLDGESPEQDGGKERRYRWLSSRYYANGTKSGTWIHVAGDVSSKTACLTEGPLKGDVASFHDGGALFICVAGVNATDGLREVIQALGVNEVLLAADMDKVTNAQVRIGFENIAGVISKLRGVRIRPLNWNVCIKGIDDYYLVRRKAYEKGKTMRINDNAITSYIQALWEKEYPKQDAGWIGSCEWEEAVRPLCELSIFGPEDLEKAKRYKVMMENGAAFPPVIVVNGTVIDGLHRCHAYAEAGREHVRVYQNKPLVLRDAA
ncbi:MAG: hypothetical protein LBL15_05810 [Oscillospiraceae bacterium]|jgi:hypothetical protein|nr:hypothetical protein [Oscillospiraceae bacterium]